MTVLGQVEHMDAMMRMVYLLVLPSYYVERVPRGLIEAAAMGLPIITTNLVTSATASRLKSSV